MVGGEAARVLSPLVNTDAVPRRARYNMNNVGPRLRELRKKRRLSLAEVSEATQISTSFLSLVETGRSDITFSRLMKLVDVYGVSITDLLPGSDDHDPVVVRASARREISSPREGINVFLLAPTADGSMMPTLEEYARGARFDGTVSHSGDEFILVLDGVVELFLEPDERIALKEGDSAYYSAERSHSCRNIGDDIARVLCVITPPNWRSVGLPRKEDHPHRPTEEAHRR